VVAFEQILGVVVDNGLLLPIEKSPITGCSAVVFIDVAIPPALAVDLPVPIPIYLMNQLVRISVRSDQ
jgi:hypothetical protein